jgi:hypothetical protein
MTDDKFTSLFGSQRSTAARPLPTRFDEYRELVTSCSLGKNVDVRREALSAALVEFAKQGNRDGFDGDEGDGELAAFSHWFGKYAGDLGKLFAAPCDGELGYGNAYNDCALNAYLLLNDNPQPIPPSGHWDDFERDDYDFAVLNWNSLCGDG